MASQDDLRIGDAERDAVATALHDHFAQGRLDQAELDERLDAVLAAKTRRDLAAVVRDLPAPTGLPEPEPAPAGALFGPNPLFPGPGTHPAWQHYDRHMRRHLRHQMRHHHRRHGFFPAFPLMIALFVGLAVTAHIGAALLAVLIVGLAVWTVRAALVLTGRRGDRAPR
ncbi:DUF1707 SHOCT-like domain-containing protein [Actinomadura parmotrematis]|uniref:DUF1707 domain-containing protein n=1 Tax=Actinomadura parmotrematis TaxID=2864039 RepID=A0ABS7FRD7_9ACTN|nr:DUF1707 domain-containing protein [Actinomadura parmotrematis]MBW8482289.1 DUF1707 domain-containing protein [Actinomadura parmotrematis]